MTVRRRIVVGRTNDAGKRNAFGKGKLAKVFAEVGNTGLGETTNAEAAAIAKINFIGIQLENLLLCETLLELQRNHGLGEFAAPGALIGEEKGAPHLHGDGASTLVVAAAMAQVGPCRADNAHEVESAMLEEALVFGGKNGAH